jgi:hypothetical protein
MWRRRADEKRSTGKLGPSLVPTVPCSTAPGIVVCEALPCQAVLNALAVGLQSLYDGLLMLFEEAPVDLYMGR